MMSFEFIREQRKKLGLTQMQLAKKAGFSVSVIKRFEAHRSYNPHGSHLISLGKVLNISSNFLLFELTWLGWD